MSVKRKVYVVGGDNSYANWCQSEIVNNIEDSTIVMFSGGADVTPSLYGKKAHPTTSNNWRRDQEEIVEFNKARELGKAIWGSCRGSQFGAVMAGSQLIQNSTQPYRHRVKTNTDKILWLNSTHHQQQYPYNMPPEKFHLLAWAVDEDGGQLSPYLLGENDNDDMSGNKEVEMAFYPEIRMICCQSHPEMCYPPREEWEKEFIEYCRELMATYLY